MLIITEIPKLRYPNSFSFQDKAGGLPYIVKTQ